EGDAGLEGVLEVTLADTADGHHSELAEPRPGLLEIDVRRNAGQLCDVDVAARFELIPGDGRDRYGSRLQALALESGSHQHFGQPAVVLRRVLGSQRRCRSSWRVGLGRVRGQRCTRAPHFQADEGPETDYGTECTHAAFLPGAPVRRKRLRYRSGRPDTPLRNQQSRGCPSNECATHGGTMRSICMLAAAAAGLHSAAVADDFESAPEEAPGL